MKAIFSIFIAATIMLSAVPVHAAELVNVGNKFCPVSGAEISAGAMAPITYEYKGKIYNLCCEGCIETFKADPEKYSANAEAEVAVTGKVQGEVNAAAIQGQ